MNKMNDYKFNFKMEMEVMDIVDKFIGKDFYESQIEFTEEIDNCLGTKTEEIDIFASDIIHYYLLEELLSEDEIKGACQFIDYYLSKDEHSLDECFAEALHMVVHLGYRMHGVIAMNPVFIHYLGKHIEDCDEFMIEEIE